MRRTAASPASIANVGIAVNSGANSVIKNNHSLSHIVGAYAGSGTHDNTFRNNDFTGNGTDCEDYSSLAAAVGTANTWTDNLGNVDAPDGLCVDGSIQSEPGSPT